jgi:hypothetical protein
MWLQHDGTLPHFSRHERNRLNHNFRTSGLQVLLILPIWVSLVGMQRRKPFCYRSIGQRRSDEAPRHIHLGLTFTTGSCHELHSTLLWRQCAYMRAGGGTCASRHYVISVMCNVKFKVKRADNFGMFSFTVIKNNKLRHLMQISEFI